MSYQYDQYLTKHKENVKNGFDWIRDNLPELVEDVPMEWQCCFAHDRSKSEPDEYGAYDDYFYGNNKSYQVVQDYRKAWLLHIHRNPHHWQYWVLINDDSEEGEILIEMPVNYILEMICDWWAFSWAKGNLHEIFKWYDEHKNYIKLHTNTRKKVEEILARIKEKLDEETFELAHHGIKGQKWGVKNGPPYPISSNNLDKSSKNDKIKMDLQMFAKIPEKKFTHYALDPKNLQTKPERLKKPLAIQKKISGNLLKTSKNMLIKISL